MRSSKLNLASLIAVAAISGLSAVGAQMPKPRNGSSRHYTAIKPKRDTDQSREIADWNAAVDRRKAEKHARKIERRGA